MVATIRAKVALDSIDWQPNNGWVKDVKDATIFEEQATYGFDDVKGLIMVVLWQARFDSRWVISI